MNLEQKWNQTLVGFGSILLGLLPLLAQASPIEIVESIPIETTLATPGIRDTQTVWLEMIAGAQRTIDLEQFYIQSKAGESLEPVLNAVKTAAARGVTVRMIVDNNFYKTNPADADALSHAPGVQVKKIDYAPHGGIQHAKYFVVDGTDAFFGSANFDWLALTHIHEVGLRTNDAGITMGLNKIFTKDWTESVALTTVIHASLVANFRSEVVSDTRDVGKVPAADRTAHVDADLILVASPASTTPSGIDDSLTNIVALIGAAHTSVKVQVYQYATKPYNGGGHWKTLDDALRAAARRGVQVQLLVDQASLNTGKPDLQALARIPNAEVRVVTIPQWSGGHLDYARLVHSKYFTIDGTTSWLGTENWQDTYFTSSRNVGAIVRSAAATAQLDQIYDRLWNSPYVKQP